jgi:hypothetical protein
MSFDNACLAKEVMLTKAVQAAKMGIRCGIGLSTRTICSCTSRSSIFSETVQTKKLVQSAIAVFEPFDQPALQVI